MFKIRTEFLIVKLKGKALQKYTGVLNLVLDRRAWTQLTWLEGSGEYGNEPSNSLKGEKFLSLVTVLHSRTVLRVVCYKLQTYLVGVGRPKQNRNKLNGFTS